MTKEETVSEVAAINAAVRAIWLTRGVRLGWDGTPGRGERGLPMNSVFILKVLTNEGQVAVAWPGLLAGV